MVVENKQKYLAKDVCPLVYNRDKGSPSLKQGVWLAIALFSSTCQYNTHSWNSYISLSFSDAA
jgi:hypothetical protein